MSGQLPDSSAGRPVYFRLSEEQHDRLREIAASQHRTVSAELRRLVESLIAEHDEVAA